MITYFAGTHPGCKHELNEDCLGSSEANSVWLVADGMGGHAAGEVASHIARDKVLAEVALGSSLKDAVMSAHQTIFEAANSKPAQAGMGTTIVATRIDGYLAEFVWVGDSRAYLWRDGALKVLTKDHSFVEMLIAEHKLTPEEAHRHPQRNIVTQVLGVGEPKPDRRMLRLHQHDWILLCSDGLNDELLDKDIAMLLREGLNVESAVAALLNAACNNGGRDNISAIVVQYNGESAPAADPATIRRSVPESLRELAASSKPHSFWRTVFGQSVSIGKLALWGGLGILALLSVYVIFGMGK